MASIQYIGARYVPQVYEGSDGSSNWVSGVQYQPLTVVTYNNLSYTSRTIVPGSIGNPADNPEYWAKTADYNAQFAELQNIVGTFDNRITAAQSNASQAQTSVIQLNYSKLPSNLKNRRVVLLETISNPSLLAQIQTIFSTDSKRYTGYSLVGDILQGHRGWGDELGDLPIVQYQDQNVTDVIAIGGSDDLSASSSAIAEGAQKLKTACASLFPNANISMLYIGLNTANMTQSGNTFTSYMTACLNQHIVFNEWAYGLMFSNEFSTITAGTPGACYIRASGISQWCACIQNTFGGNPPSIYIRNENGYTASRVDGGVTQCSCDRLRLSQIGRMWVLQSMMYTFILPQSVSVSTDKVMIGSKVISSGGYTHNLEGYGMIVYSDPQDSYRPYWWGVKITFESNNLFIQLLSDAPIGIKGEVVLRLAPFELRGGYVGW